MVMYSANLAVEEVVPEVENDSAVMAEYRALWVTIALFRIKVEVSRIFCCILRNTIDGMA